jgi:uncharacterized membrane-anchored protein YhcB (DUF1043 family)
MSSKPVKTLEQRRQETENHLTDTERALSLLLKEKAQLRVEMARLAGEIMKREKARENFKKGLAKIEKEMADRQKMAVSNAPTDATIEKAEKLLEHFEHFEHLKNLFGLEHLEVLEVLQEAKAAKAAKAEEAAQAAQVAR